MKRKPILTSYPTTLGQEDIVGGRALRYIWETFEANFALIRINLELLRGLEGLYKV